MTKFKNPFTEQLIEDTAITLFQEQGYVYLAGDEINPNPTGKCLRADFDIAYYLPTLKEALIRINPSIPTPIIEEAINEIIHPKTSNLTQENKRIFNLITLGLKFHTKTRLSQLRLLIFKILITILL